MAHFRNTAMAGYLLITLLLAAGMAIGVRRLDTVADAEADKLRADESKVALVERLRWNAERIVAAERSYLDSGESDLSGLREAAQGFDDTLSALTSRPHSAGEAARLSTIERLSSEFRDTQSRLVRLQTGGQPGQDAFRSFHTELIPLYRALNASVDDYLEYKQGQIQTAFDESDLLRANLAKWALTLLAGLVCAGLAISWYFSRLLSSAFQQQQRALDTARAAVAARNELMGIVAHDLRNPLGAISLKAAMLRRAALSDEARTEAKSIESIALRMGSLIRTMLDVSTIEEGHFSVKTTPASAERLLRETLDMFTTVAASKGIRLESGSSGQGLTVDVDRERMIEVLSNLIGNALKFTPPGGQVALSIDRAGETARFSVTDSGPGIAAEDLPHLFERFWKHELHGTKGTGLGLFIAKGIVDAHGGRIWAENAPGRGATFRFEVRLAAADAQTVSPLEGSRPAPA